MYILTMITARRNLDPQILPFPPPPARRLPRLVHRNLLQHRLGPLQLLRPYAALQSHHQLIRPGEGGGEEEGAEGVECGQGAAVE